MKCWTLFSRKNNDTSLLSAELSNSMASVKTVYCIYSLYNKHILALNIVFTLKTLLTLNTVTSYIIQGKALF